MTTLEQVNADRERLLNLIDNACGRGGEMFAGFERLASLARSAVPTGQVAAARDLLDGVVTDAENAARYPMPRVREALSRLAAAAQRAAALEKERTEGASRGGTMTAEELEGLPEFYAEHGKLPPLQIEAMFQHLSAQGARIAALETQLPSGMKDCTILFKECANGHGRLTAANWVDQGCSACKVAALEAELDVARQGFDSGSSAEATIKTLEQHVTRLEKSLENARVSEDAWLRRLKQAAEALADVLPGEAGRLDLLSRIAALKTERDEWCRKAAEAQHGWRITVDDRDAAVADNAALIAEIERSYADALDAASKSHPGADLLTKYRAEVEALKADNAALQDALNDLRGTVAMCAGHIKAGVNKYEVAAGLRSVLDKTKPQPHPGGALLERLKQLEEAFRAISGTVGIERKRHLKSCLRYGGRVFDEHASACTVECAAARAVMDVIE